MEPWYKVVAPRKEVREGRSFNPDEFAIALEQVVAGTAPEDYRNPAQFFERTCFTRALSEHVGMVLRRLSGETANTAPVLTLITQFGGGKTHTLATLYHLARAGAKASEFMGVQDLLENALVSQMPEARVGVFVGNAWDPHEGRETPWIDLAWQLAGEAGVRALGSAAKTTPPGTESIARVFDAANAPVLVLFDEVLNFMNRHRGMTEPFHAFIQNLTVAMTGNPHGAAVISLPRSQVEMTDWDLQWQEKITKVVRRVAKDLIANDEAEIGEVVRRRLFADLGGEKLRKNVAKAYADWCFERRAQLPPEWTAVDTATTEQKAREYLQQRFESCYPFHPATLSVFQRKWQALAQFQQTRGTLAMLAQWIARAYRDGFTKARTEPLITLGSAPLEVSEFRSVVLGQLGESRLVAAIEADIAGPQSHARALDADTKGPLRNIHRRVATAVLFESSGGQSEKVAHMPELYFALGEPDIDTTSIHTAALALESKAYFVRKTGADGFQVRYQPTLKKVVNDRRASLDEEGEILPEMRRLVRNAFESGATVPVLTFPEDSTSVQDSPRLTLVIVDPLEEWAESGPLRQQLATWTRQRGQSNRLYPGSLVWCVKRPGRDLREKVELSLAWRRVQKEVRDGTLGKEFDRTDFADIMSKVADADTAAKDEVWAGYRFVVLADIAEQDGLKVIDLGAGHASAAETLCIRIMAALKSEALLNESVGAGYIERNWPPALKDAGAWPLSGLRQSFLNGSLTRLVDPDRILKGRIAEFVEKGDFGLGSEQRPDGGFQRVWFEEHVGTEEINFESGVFLLRKERCLAVRRGQEGATSGEQTSESGTSAPKAAAVAPTGTTVPSGELAPEPTSATQRLTLSGELPPEAWNRFGTKVLPKLRSADDLRVMVNIAVTLDSSRVGYTRAELEQALQDLGLDKKFRFD